MTRSPAPLSGDLCAARVRTLERMQRFHYLYLQYGKIASMLLFFVAVVVSLKLDRYGWSKMADALIKIMLVTCLLGLFCFLINLFAVRSWRCPRCNVKTTGWVEKEKECFGCGLKLSTRF